MAITLTTATGLAAAAQCATVTGLAMAMAKAKAKAKAKVKAKVVSKMNLLARSAMVFVTLLSFVRPRMDHMLVMSALLFKQKANGAGAKLLVYALPTTGVLIFARRRR